MNVFYTPRIQTHLLRRAISSYLEQLRGRDTVHFWSVDGRTVRELRPFMGLGGFQAFDEDTRLHYVVVTDGARVAAVFRLRSDGQLRRMKRPPGKLLVAVSRIAYVRYERMAIISAIYMKKRSKCDDDDELEKSLTNELYGYQKFDKSEKT